MITEQDSYKLDTNIPVRAKRGEAFRYQIGLLSNGKKIVDLWDRMCECVDLEFDGDPTKFLDRLNEMKSMICESLPIRLGISTFKYSQEPEYPVEKGIGLEQLPDVTNLIEVRITRPLFQTIMKYLPDIVGKGLIDKYVGVEEVWTQWVRSHVRFSPTLQAFLPQHIPDYALSKIEDKNLDITYACHDLLLRQLKNIPGELVFLDANRGIAYIEDTGDLGWKLIDIDSTIRRLVLKKVEVFVEDLRYEKDKGIVPLMIWEYDDGTTKVSRMGDRLPDTILMNYNAILPQVMEKIRGLEPNILGRQCTISGLEYTLNNQIIWPD